MLEYYSIYNTYECMIPYLLHLQGIAARNALTTDDVLAMSASDWALRFVVRFGWVFFFFFFFSSSYSFCFLRAATPTALSCGSSKRPYIRKQEVEAFVFIC